MSSTDDRCLALLTRQTPLVLDSLAGSHCYLGLAAVGSAPKSGARISIQFSLVGDKDPMLWAITASPQSLL